MEAILLEPDMSSCDAGVSMLALPDNSLLPDMFLPVAHL
jgi:hypothetical protein